MKKIIFLITIFLVMSFSICYSYTYEEVYYSGLNSVIIEKIMNDFSVLRSGGWYSSTDSSTYETLLSDIDNYDNFALYVADYSQGKQVFVIISDGLFNVQNQFNSTNIFISNRNRLSIMYTISNTRSDPYTNISRETSTSSISAPSRSPNLYKLVKNDGIYYQMTDSLNIGDLNSPIFSANGTPSSVQYFDGTIYNLNVDYSISGKQLGQIENNQYGSNYFATLYQVQLNDNVVVRYGKVCDSTNGNDLYINNTGIDIGNHGFISLPSRFLASGKFYELNITYTDVGGSSKYINTYFYINGSTSGSGDLIVRSGDSYGSLIDLTETNIIANNQNDNTANIIDTINDVTSYNSGDIATVIDSTFDISGEFFGFLTEWGSGDGVNYYNFLYDFFQSLLTTLTSTGEVVLPISYRDYTLNLSSNAFIIADNPIKTFAKLFLITGFVFLIFQDLNKQYKHIREFNVYSVLHDTDVDYNMFL